MIEVRAALPLMFAMTGCDLVFGLDDRVVVDASAADAPDAEAPCQRTTGTVFAISDTTLIPDPMTCDPSIRFGTYPNVNLGQISAGKRSRILARFSLQPDMIAGFGGDGFESATLTIPLKPVECPGVCVSAAISFSVYAANNDWHEGESSGNIGTEWCMRKQLSGPGTGVRWIADGADGLGTDRSDVSLADMTMTPAQAAGDELVVPISRSPAFADLTRWVDGTQLSILLVPSGAVGTVFTKAKDYVPSGGMALQVTTCRQ
ncbi:MAG: hypothetical protein ACKV2T_15125 [Kofleriaceae bacterium]